ncbi:lipoprotein [Spiroplasma eriocheiris]|uniref:Lipoprotein n=1 Tax=Spiroplasma eriocheiris TaxID=315358 RepID=A0A0H3XHR9_9MOLU|nr:lipoprotein [Spiroplasma eriocheiris]AHF57458.1 hypothetical protein SPE_0329 [Spiroplasma eriocheiris CCTCC M 207170]AKM53915.1 hypothetical protein SERIO_v1c03330 [Spiroplasma eriocheiris]
MKKLFTLLGAITLSGVSTSSLVACNHSTKSDINKTYAQAIYISFFFVPSSEGQTKLVTKLGQIPVDMTQQIAKEADLIQLKDFNIDQVAQIVNADLAHLAEVLKIMNDKTFYDFSGVTLTTTGANYFIHQNNEVKWEVNLTLTHQVASSSYVTEIHSKGYFPATLNK